MTFPDRPPPAGDQPPLTLRGVWQGARLVAVLLPGVIIFAGAFGAAAAAKGLSLGEAVLMSALVYAGVSQLVAMELWQPAWTWGAILALAAVTATVNVRMVLQGASLQPWLGQYPARLNALHLFFFTDANWLVGTRYHADGGRDLGVMFGAGLALWVVWVAMTVPGHLLGALVADPRRFGLDLVMPIFFAAMIVPLWRGQRAALPWLAAGVVALAVSKLLPGYGFIVAGSLAGALCGALMPERA